MTYKSTTRPLCRCCGEPIPMETTTRTCRVKPSPSAPIGRHDVVLDRYPLDTAACQKLVNEKVVHVSRFGGGVRWFSTWDGESYIDEFFCKQKCAVAYGYRMARLNKNAEQLERV